MAGHDAAADGFWRFSLLVYGRPGVAEALIGLQDRAGHNVNMMLFALWLGLCEGMRLDAAGLKRARMAIARLDGAAVMPLRRLRRALAGDTDPELRGLARRVLALEIEAERRAQARLAASAAPRRRRAAGSHALAEANLRSALGADADAAEAAIVLRAIAAP